MNVSREKESNKRELIEQLKSKFGIGIWDCHHSFQYKIEFEALSLDLRLEFKR